MSRRRYSWQVSRIGRARNMTNSPPNWSDGFQVTAGPLFFGLVDASPETKEYWDGLAASRLLIKRCAVCRQHLHPRRMMCSACQSFDLAWVPVSGRATLYSFSTVHRSPVATQSAVPYTVGIVTLEEGVHLFSRIDSRPETLTIGITVELFFDSSIAGYLLPVFRASVDENVGTRSG